MTTDPNLPAGLLVLVLLVVPLLATVTLGRLLRKRGGGGAAWGGAIFLGLCLALALWVLLEKTAL
jgi:hypothetical protein